ncbi:MAG: hypothetical protein B7Y95_14820 [Rhizobiales bacterium 32-66-11]|nr:MAG: hypothetical protein B7Y95_14820 [Rhizobiales bacterium 32-66-11]
MSTVPSPARPISVRPDDFQAIYGISRSRVYELIAEGAFPVRKVGRSTIVFTEDVERYLKALPTGLDAAPEKATSARKAKTVGGRNAR